MAHSIFNKTRTERRMNFKVSRFNETYANFIAIAEIFKIYLLDTGCMSEMEISQLIDSDMKAITSVIHANDADAVERPNEEIIAEFINSAMLSQKNSSESIEVDERVDEYNEFYVVTQQKFPVLLKKYFSEIGKVLPYYSTTDLSKFMANKGLILVKVENGQTRYAHKLTKLYGLNKRYYYFFKSKIDELVGK